MEKHPMTLRGAERLRTELTELKTVKRPAVIAAIAEARAHGDLKENAEYHAAREQQGFIEGRIKDIESKLSHAQIIDVSTLGAGGKVGHTLVDVARNAIAAAGTSTTITAVDCVPMPVIEAMGVKTITCDLLDTQAVATLPDVENVVFMAGRKFGSAGKA